MQLQKATPQENIQKILAASTSRTLGGAAVSNLTYQKQLIGSFMCGLFLFLNGAAKNTAYKHQTT